MAVGKNIRRVNNIWEKPTAICFFVPDQKYVQLVFVLLRRCAPTAHLMLPSSSSPQNRGDRETKKLCPSPKMPQPNQRSILPKEGVISPGAVLAPTVWLLDVNWEGFYRKKKLSKTPFPLSNSFRH